MPITSKIHPDEFSRGYRGRIRIPNITFPSTKSFMAALREELHPPGTPQDDCPDAATLALAAGMSLMQFVRSHTLIPLFRMAPPKDEGVIHGDPSRLDIIKYYGTLTWDRINPRFCLDCIKEDLDFWRYTYWRRSHQFPGICWCSKHGTQLAISSLGNKAFDETPSLEMEAHFEFSPQEFKQISDNPVIQRYADILFSFLDSERPIASIHAMHRISEQIKKQSIRTAKAGKRPKFTDRILEQCPMPWVRALYPSIDKRLASESFNPIDCLPSTPVANHTYALALAVLFDSSDEAVNYWSSKAENFPKNRKSHRKYGWDFWNSKEMYDLYVSHFGNIITMSEELGIDSDIVRQCLMAAGLPALGRLGKSCTGLAIVDFQGGMSLKAACEANGATQEVVEKLLRTGICKISNAIKENIQPKIRKNTKSSKTKASSAYEKTPMKPGHGRTESTNSHQIRLNPSRTESKLPPSHPLGVTHH